MEVNRKIIYIIRKIDDKYVLEDIAMSDFDYNVRIEAIRKIDDMSVLGNIAMRDSDYNVRKEAHSRIFDNKLLLKLQNAPKKINQK